MMAGPEEHPPQPPAFALSHLKLRYIRKIGEGKPKLTEIKVLSLAERGQ